MMDFTISTYTRLLKTLSETGLFFLSFEDFINDPLEKSIVLRHDVDKLPQNSLQFARIQAKMNIRATYFFRTVPGCYNENIISEIFSLGHEIGYHYEDIEMARIKLNAKKYRSLYNMNRDSRECRIREDTENLERELVEIAIMSFQENLAKLRDLVPVNTICMHGSPTCPWDNRVLWKYYDYHDFGIKGEPYLDVDFSKVLYLTDTGRRWNGNIVNIRDHVTGPMQIHEFRSTFDIIRAAVSCQLPDYLLMTFHPQRWTNNPGRWIKEITYQNLKNVVKYLIIKSRA